MERDEVKKVLKQYYQAVVPLLVPAFIGGAGIVSFRFLRWFGLILVVPLAIVVVYVFAEPLLDRFLDMVFGTEET